MTKTKFLRIAAVVAGLILVASGGIGKLYYQGLCTLGTGEVWATCPLGYLERSLATRQLLPEWPSALLVLLAIVVLGRVFCAWVCPSVLIRRVWGDNGKFVPRREGAAVGIEWSAYSSYAVLVGVLLASFVFQFPIFCLFCPVGLTFGAVYAGIRFFDLGTPGIELVLFPAMLAAELWVLRGWCRSICPLGALYSLAGNLNRFIRPVATDKCFMEKGINCQVCRRACPEGIDLADKRRRFQPNACTKCLACSDKCPKGAIKYKLWV